ncbi:MAG TPA: hypothetical protein VKP30_16455, partial [Polyangiaceae bacterium]|nr:hypothetical protein [Polyangiaceae bacterium]
MSSSVLPEPAPLVNTPRPNSLDPFRGHSHLRNALRHSSPQDWIVCVYLLILNLVLLLRVGEAGYLRSALQMSSLLLLFVLVLFPVSPGGAVAADRGLAAGRPLRLARRGRRAGDRQGDGERGP